MAEKLTHGSLFAGIGGFELAAKEAGIKTLWNCEIEPWPRLVLAARFPGVKQYGDIRKLSGAEVEPVDCVSFGSPCQSFSQAAGASRKGLDGASGLFYEAVRVIREMREATGNRLPRYAIMENGEHPGGVFAVSIPANRKASLIFGRFSMSCSKSAIKPSMFLCLKAGSFSPPGPSWATVTHSPTERSAPPNSESPSAAVGCSLSSVLMMNAPPKYYLSRTAKDGILRRVTSRGKVLPEVLRKALEA